MIPKRINDWFEEHKFDDETSITFELKWRKYDVYVVAFKEYGNYGLPIFVLDDGKNIRFSNYEEKEEILKTIAKNESL